MNDFNRQDGSFRSSRPSGGGGFNRGGGDRGGRPGFNRGGRDGERAQMHPATCDNCHKQCEVPFKPTNHKPVYCKDCFGTMRSESLGRPEKKEYSESSPSSAPQPSNRNDDLKKQIDAMNVKIDKILSLLGGAIPQTPKGSVLKIENAAKSKPMIMPPQPTAAVAAPAPKVEAPSKKEKKIAPKKVVTKKKPTAKKK
jgi:CxxC-x17-CxxC domain-containing protein